MKVISHGILTVGGIVSLAIGSLILFDSPDPALRVSYEVMIPVLIIISLFFVGVIILVVKAQRRKKHTGADGMIGWEGVAIADIREEGKVFLKGEYWNARADHPIPKGRKVRVIGVEGLKLKVEEASPSQEGFKNA